MLISIFWHHNTNPEKNPADAVVADADKYNPEHCSNSAAETKAKGAMIMDGQRLASWYDFYRTGEAQHFFALMSSLPSSSEE